MAQVIGTAPNQIPSNANLGDLAYRNKSQIAGEFATSAQGTTADTALQPADLGATDLPEIAPSLNLDFANAQSVTSKATFTRASTATYYDANGTLQTAAANSPRFDHDPATGERLGVLIEEQRTNLLTYSEQFDNGTWSKTDVTVTANAVMAPDGTTTAEKLVESATTGVHRIAQAATTDATEVHTAVVYVKAAERTQVNIGMVASPNFYQAIFDLNTLSSSGGGGGTFTDVGTSIVLVGDGWFRCSITAAFGSGASVNVFIDPAEAGSASYTGDGTSGIYLWGVQLEEGSFPTSYIKTEASQVTRSADNLSITGTDFTNFYNQSEGTFVVDVEPKETSGSVNVVCEVSDGTYGNRIFINGSGSDYLFSVSVSASSNANIPVGSFAQSVPQKVAGAYKVNDIFAAASNLDTGSDASSAIPVVDRLKVGGQAAGGGTLSCHIKSLTYYPRRLTNAQLQALTTE